jgi:replication factor A2
MHGGGSQHDGNGGAANANNIFGGGGFTPPRTTSTPEGSSAIAKVLLSPLIRSNLSYIVSLPNLIGTFVGSPCAQTRAGQTLIPLTVKQIVDASQTNDDRSNFAVNGTEVSMVQILPPHAVL